jgi:hypothetical protein
MNWKDFVKTKISFALILAVAVLTAITTLLHRPEQTGSSQITRSETNLSLAPPADSLRPAIVSEAPPQSRPSGPVVRESTFTTPSEPPAVTTNKVERLKQIRETFSILAAGDRATALRSAKQITDETEREAALLTLVTEWTHGELSSTRLRARAIDTLGLEAGLALELTNNPELAVLWANELTEGTGRFAVLRQTAFSMLGSDPAGAFALSEQLPPIQRREFVDALFAGWGGTDTEAAMNFADQMPDPDQRDAAIQAIRTSAPVGIGAELRIQGGYAVINRVLPGSAAEQNGQIQAGDRILALAQGDNSFVDARSLPLEKIVQMVRGAPNSLLQLQVLPADAPPDSVPRTVSIVRNQIKFKR